MKDSSYHWQKTWLTKEFNFYKLQKPSKNTFQGQAYILTNGLCLSSCADVIAILRHNQKALVIGQESGGGYQGNNSGIIPTVGISGELQMTIPLMKYTNAVEKDKHFGHGTIPDYLITPTFQNWIDKKDVEMAFALKLISKN